MRRKSKYESAMGRPKSAIPLEAQYAFRSSKQVRADFLRWVAKENEGRIIPISEADALRLLVTWAGRTCPKVDDLTRDALASADRPTAASAPEPKKKRSP